MNWAHVHLLLNHIPVFGTLFGIVLLLVAVSRKNEGLQKACLGVFIVVAVMTIAPYLTGEPAEDVVEDLADVSKPMIEEHEESALVSLIGIELLGLASLITLWFSRKANVLPRRWVTACLILSIATLSVVAWTSHLGGQIRHTETRTGFEPPGHPHSQAENPPNGGEK